MVKSRKQRRGGADEDPKKPQAETIPAVSIPAENPVTAPSLGPDPPGPSPRMSSTGTLIAEEDEGGRRRRRTRRKIRKNRKYSRRR